MKVLRNLLPLLVVVVLFFGYVFYAYPSFFNFGFSQKEPSLQVVIGDFAGAQVYELSGNRLRDISFSTTDGDSITSRSRRAHIGSTMTVFMQSGEITNTLILENSEGARFVDAAPFGIKDRPTLSFDGNLIAYAHLTLEPGVLYSEYVADWHVQVIDAETGMLVDLGVGYAPYFISSAPQVVMFSAPEGIVAVNLDTNERVVVGERQTTFVHQAAVASPDGAHIASYNELTNHYTIFEVRDAEFLTLNPIGEVPETFDVVALSNTSLWGAHRDDTTGVFTLLEYSFENIIPPITYIPGKEVYTFTENEIPYQLVP